MFHKIKVIFTTVFAMVFFIIALASCKESNSALEQRVKWLEQKTKGLKKELNSQHAEEYDQALKECKDLANNPNADPNKVAEAEKKLAEIESKMGIVHFAAIECKHGSIFAPL